MSAEPLALPAKEEARFAGGRSALLASLLLGALGWIGCAIGFAVTPNQMLHSYLVAWGYFASLSIGALVWLMSLHAAKTKWAVNVRRLLELMAATIGLLLVLMIPVFVGMKELYPWVDPSRLTEPTQEVARHNHVYLNPTGFVLRAVVFFAFWALCANFQLRWSRAQDDTRDVPLTLWQRRLGAVGLPLIGVSLTLGAFDWFMSLEPEFRSTVFGLYYFSGGFVGAMALLIVLTTLADRAGYLRGLVNLHHYHNLGKLLFAFVCFWAYIAFAQYLLQWMGNLPDSEIPYYLLRLRHGWTGVSMLLVIGHFAVPFGILLSAGIKKRPAQLAAIAGWILFIHWVDVYWLVMPFFDVTPALRWHDLAAFCAVGGVTLFYGLLRARGDYLAPVGDPYFEDSVAFHK